MLKRTMAVVFAMVIALTAGSASAQCVIGVYGDADGTKNLVQPTQGQEFNVYVVLFTENVVNAASYALEVPGLLTDVFVTGTEWGASGNGFSITTGNGENVALGECAVGFGGLPVLVSTYTMLFPLPAPGRTFEVLPNADEDPVFPVYSDCAGQLGTCEMAPALVVEPPVANESASFGQVKSLFNN